MVTSCILYVCHHSGDMMYHTIISLILGDNTCISTDAHDREVAIAYTIEILPGMTQEDCVNACCNDTSCYAISISNSSGACYLQSAFPYSATEYSSDVKLYFLVPDPVDYYLDVQMFSDVNCPNQSFPSAFLSYPVGFCVPYLDLAYTEHAYHMYQVEYYASTSSFAVRHLVWFEAPGCTAPPNEWTTPNINETQEGSSCYNYYLNVALKDTPRDIPEPVVTAVDNYQPQFVLWRRDTDTCSLGPPRSVSYRIGLCYVEESLRKSFMFERTATHPEEGYQMEMNWWEDSTTCTSTPMSTVNVTWGCRSTNPGSGYFTFDSSPIPNVCNATTTVGLDFQGVDGIYQLETLSSPSWDSCLNACCNRSDCYAFTLTFSQCDLYREFPPSDTVTDINSTLYYMVRDDRTTPGLFLNTVVYHNDACTGSADDYISYPIEACIPYNYLAYSDHTYQLFRIESYTDSRTFILRHLVWFDAPGCTAPESEWDTADVNETRTANDCYKNYSFDEVNYSPSTIPRFSAVTTQDNYQPEYVNQEIYPIPCTSPATSNVSYEIGYCYRGSAVSFSMERTVNHPTLGYQMRVQMWVGSTTCLGTASQTFNVVWGCHAEINGSFTFSSSPAYPPPSGFDLPSVMPSVPSISNIPSVIVFSSLLSVSSFLMPSLVHTSSYPTFVFPSSSPVTPSGFLLSSPVTPPATPSFSIESLSLVHVTSSLSTPPDQFTSALAPSPTPSPPMTGMSTKNRQLQLHLDKLITLCTMFIVSV